MLSYVCLHFLIEFSAFQNLICGILGYSSFPNYLSVDVGLDRSASLRDLSILFLLASIFARPYCAFLLTQQRAVLAHSCRVYVKRPIGVCPCLFRSLAVFPLFVSLASHPCSPAIFIYIYGANCWTSIQLSQLRAAIYHHSWSYTSGCPHFETAG